ncbi:MAG TPA: hypothetical protein VE820_00790 [Sphingomicrobium sp.]|nr:hypothetical protein [Sphingomicrobium sp.]
MKTNYDKFADTVPPSLPANWGGHVTWRPPQHSRRDPRSTSLAGSYGTRLMSKFLLHELRVIAGQFAELEANLIALKELEVDSPERLALLQAAEGSAKRACRLVQLQIDRLTSNA